MIRLHIIRTIIFALLGLGVGFLIMSMSPKVYEGRAQLVLGVQTQNLGRIYSSTLNEDVANILQSGMGSNPMTEIQVIKGEAIFMDALRKVESTGQGKDLVKNFETLYGLYDVASSNDASAVLIRARAYDPVSAAAIANEVGESYNTRRQNSLKARVAQALDYLEGQKTLAKQELHDAEESLKKTKQETGLPEISANVQRDIEYQAQLRAQIDIARADMAGLDKSITETESEIRSKPQYEPADFTEQKNMTLQQLENRLSELESQKQTLLVDYFEDSSQVKLINGAIASVKQQVANLKRNGFENMVRNRRPDQLRRALESRLSDFKIQRQGVEQKVAMLQGNLNSQTVKIDQIPESYQKLADVAREVEIKDSNYKRLMVQYEDLKNRSETGSAVRAAEIIRIDQQDTEPVLPRPALVYVVSILAGAILGLLISFAVEAIRLRIYSSTQLQELTGLPVAGVVHDLPGPTARRLLTSVREPNPLVSESYRFLAFSAMTRKQEGPKVVLLTAVDNKAGCSTSAVQFAAALAQAGSRVLLVDCALENPTITKVFGLEQKSGVSDILSQTQLPTPDSQLGFETATPNLRVMGAGSEGASAIKIATSQQISAMIGSLSSSADILVLDSIACLSSSDAARLVPYVSEVYLVVSARSANMRNVAAAIDVLTLASAANIKFIVTKGSRGEEAVMRQASLAVTRA